MKLFMCATDGVGGAILPRLALADRCIADFDADVILFGAASEREITEQIAARMRQRPSNMDGQTSISELRALFSAARGWMERRADWTLKEAR